MTILIFSRCVPNYCKNGNKAKIAQITKSGHLQKWVNWDDCGSIKRTVIF